MSRINIMLLAFGEANINKKASHAVSIGMMKMPDRTDLFEDEEAMKDVCRYWL